MASIKRPSQRIGLYGFFRLSADQAANLAQNDHIEFDTSDGDLVLSTGAGQADGKVTLPGGHWYRLVSAIRIYKLGAETWAYHKFYDVTNGAYLTHGISSTNMTANFAGTYSSHPTVMAEVYVESTIEVECRCEFVAAAGLTNILAAHTAWEIQEILKEGT